MRVSLTTDASLCGLTRAAAWAAWAQSERGRFFGGNALPGSFSSINSVEMHAVARGLRVALDRGVFAAGDHVALQTDSSYVAGRLMPGYVSMRNRRRDRRGLPRTVPNPAIDVGSPRGQVLAMLAEHQLTLEVTCSKAGNHMWNVDRFARSQMIHERVLRQAGSIEAAHLTAFDNAMEKGRMDYIRSIQT